MNKLDTLRALELGLDAWRAHGGPSLRGIGWCVEAGAPGPSHWNIGIDRDAKGATVIPSGRPPWWRRFLGLVYLPWRGAPKAVIFLFAECLIDPQDVRRVAWHELAHAHGLDEEEAEDVGLPAWTTDA